MAKQEPIKAAVPLEQVVLAQAFELQALLNVLERQGVIRQADVLEEVKRLKAKMPKAGKQERDV